MQQDRIVIGVGISWDLERNIEAWAAKVKSLFHISLCLIITVQFNSQMVADQTVSTFHNPTDLGRPHGAIAIFLTRNWLYKS